MWNRGTLLVLYISSVLITEKVYLLRKNVYSLFTIIHYMTLYKQNLTNLNLPFIPTEENYKMEKPWTYTYGYTDLHILFTYSTINDDFLFYKYEYTYNINKVAVIVTQIRTKYCCAHITYYNIHCWFFKYVLISCININVVI